MILFAYLDLKVLLSESHLIFLRCFMHVFNSTDHRKQACASNLQGAPTSIVAEFLTLFSLDVLSFLLFTFAKGNQVCELSFVLIWFLFIGHLLFSLTTLTYSNLEFSLICGWTYCSFITEASTHDTAICACFDSSSYLGYHRHLTLNLHDHI